MSPDSSTPIADELRHSLRRLMIATVVLWLVVLGGGGLLVWKISMTADKAHDAADKARNAAVQANATAYATSALAASNRADEITTHHALCTFRADLGKRITQTRDYLSKHPESTLFGAPRSTIEKSLSDEMRTYSTLRGLGCQ